MPDTENVVQLSRLFGVSCDYLLREEVDEQGAPLLNPQTKEQAASDDPGNGGASAVPGDRHSPSASDRSGGASAVPGDRHSPSANDRSGGANATPGDRHSPSANDRSGGASAAHLDESGWAHNAYALSLGACAIGLLLALGGHFFVNLPVLIILGLTVQLSGVILFELAVPRMGERGPLARLDFLLAACWLIIPALFTLVFWQGFWYGGLVWFTLPELVVFTLPLGAVCTAFLLFRRRRIVHKK